MVKSLIGKKVRMTATYDENGKIIPLTVLQLGPCPIVQVKTPAKDGYAAIQVGYQCEKKEKRANSPQKGHFKKAGLVAHRYLREIRVDDPDQFKPGQLLKVSLFESGELVDVSATGKGRGFAGGVVRHNWSGGRMTHGSMFHRAPGSIGQSAWPSRTVKGKTLPGQHGNKRVTVRNLRVVGVDVENHLLYVRGAVPGPNGGFVEVGPSTKRMKK